MECIIAKIFGSEAQKEAAIELFMKTHGGRSFLHGHLFGDNVHEYLAPCIYEGEGEMLGMAFFKSLVKEHGKHVLRADRQGPAGRRHQEAEPGQPGPPVGSARRRLVPYAKWLAGQSCGRRARTPVAASMPETWPRHAEFATFVPADVRRSEISRHDEQAPVEAGRPPVPHVRAFAALQDAVTILCTACVPRGKTTRSCAQAADILCQDLTSQDHRQAASDRYFRTVTKLGEAIAEAGSSRSRASRPARSDADTTANRRHRSAQRRKSTREWQVELVTPSFFQSAFEPWARLDPLLG